VLGVILLVETSPGDLPETIDHRPSTIDHRPSTIDHRPSTIDHRVSTTALIAPCTTTIRGLQSEVVLEPGDDPVPRRSAVNLDCVESVSVAGLGERLGALSGDRMVDICGALRVAVDCRD